MKQALAGCPQDIRDVFGTSGSVINNIAAKTGFNNQAYLDMLRGFVGDVYIIDAGDAGFQVGHTPPCDQNRYASFDNLLDGSVYARTAGGACAQIADSSADLTNYARTKMTRIAGKIKAKQALSDEDNAFVNASPLSVGLVLKAAVGTNQESSIISTLSDVTAKAYAFQLLSDLYTKAWNIMDKGEEPRPGSAGGRAGRAGTPVQNRDALRGDRRHRGDAGQDRGDGERSPEILRRLRPGSDGDLQPGGQDGEIQSARKHHAELEIRNGRRGQVIVTLNTRKEI